MHVCSVKLGSKRVQRQFVQLKIHCEMLRVWVWTLKATTFGGAESRTSASFSREMSFKEISISTSWSFCVDGSIDRRLSAAVFVFVELIFDALFQAFWVILLSSLVLSCLFQAVWVSLCSLVSVGSLYRYKGIGFEMFIWYRKVVRSSWVSLMRQLIAQYVRLSHQSRWLSSRSWIRRIRVLQVKSWFYNCTTSCGSVEKLRNLIMGEWQFELWSLTECVHFAWCRTQCWKWSRLWEVLMGTNPCGSYIAHPNSRGNKVQGRGVRDQEENHQGGS